MNFSEASTAGVYEKSCSKKNFALLTGKLQACNFIKRDPTQMFFSEYCEIFKNTYFEEHLLKAASEQLQNSGEQLLLYWLFF